MTAVTAELAVSALPLVVMSPEAKVVDVAVPSAEAAEPTLRQQMGARGRAKVEAQYSVQAVAPRLAQLLREAAG